MSLDEKLKWDKIDKDWKLCIMREGLYIMERGNFDYCGAIEREGCPYKSRIEAPIQLFPNWKAEYYPVCLYKIRKEDEVK